MLALPLVLALSLAADAGSPAAAAAAPAPVRPGPAPAEHAAAAPQAGSADGALDFTAEAKLLFRVVACEGDAPLPKNIDEKLLAEHCKELHRRMDLYKKTWISVAQPFLQKLKPAGLPTTVVYPFGGGDLISALTTWPEATEITTMSL